MIKRHDFNDDEWKFGIAFILTCLLALAMTSCKTTQKLVPVETVKTDSIYISSVQRDSIYVQDSVFIREKGDTILIEKTKYKYIMRLSHDTIHSEKVDSIQVPYPVEKSLTKWQEFKLKVGGFAISLGLAFALIFVGLVIYKIKRG